MLPAHRQELLADAGLAVALSAVNAVSLLPYRSQLHSLWLALLLVIAQGVPLAFRRVAPVGMGVIVGVARVAYDRIGFGFTPIPLGPAIVVYTVVDRRGPLWRWIVGLLVVAGVTISLTSPGHSEPYEAIFQGLIFLSAWGAGMLNRTRREHLAAATARADRAEAEADRAVSARPRRADHLNDLADQTRC